MGGQDTGRRDTKQGDERWKELEGGVNKKKKHRKGGIERNQNGWTDRKEVWDREKQVR